MGYKPMVGCYVQHNWHWTLSKLLNNQHWKTRVNQRNVNEFTIVYTMIHNRVTIDLNLHFVPQGTSYTKDEWLVNWYDLTWYVVICKKRTIKWYNKHLILIILAHLVIWRNRTRNINWSCLYSSYFCLMRTKKSVACKEKQN